MIEIEYHPKTKSLIENAKEILKDPKFIEQKGVRSIVDQDARVGHKSKTEHFFGYKTEYMMAGSKNDYCSTRRSWRLCRWNAVP